MTTKEIVDAGLQFLGILISWPVIGLVIVFAVWSELPGLVSKLSERMTKAPGGFEFGVLAGKVEVLSQNVERIQEELRFVPSAALTPGLQRRLTSAFTEFREYLRSLGFKPTASPITIEVDPKAAGNAYYDSSDNRIVIGPSLVHDTDVAFREYAHHALMSTRPDGWSEMAVQYQAIESGLADYFACSHNDDPLMGDDWLRADQQMREQIGRDYVRNLANQLTFDNIGEVDALSGGAIHAAGEVWGGIFWGVARVSVPEGRRSRPLYGLVGPQ